MSQASANKIMERIAHEDEIERERLKKGPENPQLLVGQAGTWRGVACVVQAWTNTPEGFLLYCTLTVGGILRACWLTSDEVQL